MKPPCDEGLIRSAGSGVGCSKEAGPWVLAAAILGSSMAFIDSTVVNVALPALQSSFHASIVDVQWVVEAYGLFLSALILVGGALGDFFGRRLVFLIGVATFAAASAVCGFSSNIQQLIVGRAMQGIGAALLVPGSLAIISSCFDEASRGRAIGTWSGFTAITSALGPVVGGWLVEHASWHWVFFINLPIAAAVVIISLWRVPESRSGVARHIDWLGALLASAGLGGVLYGLIESQSHGWRTPLVLGTLLLGIALLIVFVALEKRVNSPMVPLDLFRSPAFRGANLLTLFLYAALGIFFFLFPLNLIQVRHYSATATGAAMLPMILLLFFLSRWSGGLVARYGARTPLMVGPSIAALGFILFALPGATGSYWTSFFPAFIVLGLGMAISVAPLTTVVMSSVDQDHAGTASGINNAVARVAGVLAIAVFGVLVVSVFKFQLTRALREAGTSAPLMQQIQANAIQLAGLQLPSNLDRHTWSIIQNAITQAFVSGFRLTVLLCAGLALASSVVAWRSIPNTPAAAPNRSKTP
jgi:EmrB/QacA subfamily drug resistance transporter